MESELFRLCVAQLWQVTIATVFIGWLTKSVLKQYPTICYQLWLVVMLKCLVPPLWANRCGVFSWFFHQLTSLTLSVFNILGVSPSFMVGLVASLWLGGASLSLARFWTNWLQVRRRILASQIKTDERYQDAVTKLACDLGIRTQLQVIVTKESIGPAVVGVWRPWLVIPLQLIDGQSDESIEPIFAHELLHIRRGDTFVALLETFVRSIWWFHPTVQHAATELSCVGEICCDQDVLSKLSYPPRRYAESLLRVLEARCRLQPLVGQPGIRRDQVTRSRLRRIMTWNRDQPCRLSKGTIYALASLLLLPGSKL